MQSVDEIQNAQRLQALRASGLLDTPPEQAFDHFTALAHQIIGVPVVLISLVDAERQFFKSQLGLPEPWATQRQTPLSHSFCQHVASTRQPLIVADANQHPLVKDSAAIADIGVVAYAGVPLETSDHHVIGSFCAIDTVPHEWSEPEIQTLRALAAMVMREVELRALAQSLQARNEALQDTERRRDDMVQMLVHDIRTPLGSLVGGLQALDMMLGPSDDQRKALDISLRGARALSQMVNTILDVSRGESGLMTLDRQMVSPLSLLTSALEQVEQLSQQKSLALSLETEAALPQLRIDGSKIERVLVNLLGNAIQHTPRGGKVNISVQRQAPGESSEALLWCVSDTGVGISESDFGMIFDKYGQGRSSQRSNASTGLGLTFCKMVVELHGGAIWVESEMGQGSRFCFTTPTTPPPDAPEEQGQRSALRPST